MAEEMTELQQDNKGDEGGTKGSAMVQSLY